MKITKATISLVLGIITIVVGCLEQQTLLSNASLLFHEAGHLFLTPFGEVLYYLGGTLFELLIPTIVLIGLFKSGQKWSATLICFWYAEVFFGVSRYMSTARDRGVPLVGGNTHDWNWLFHHWGILEHNHTISIFVFSIGIFFALLGIVFGVGYALKEVRSQKSEVRSQR